MSSQSSFESTPTEAPTTPEPINATLPESREIHEAMSPTSSMAVGASSYDEPSQKTTAVDFPVHPPSSLTPPPSSQPRNLRRTAVSPINRDNTPTPSALSSPPPTITNGVKRDQNPTSAATTTFRNAEQLASASKEELREMLQAAMGENKKLEAQLASSRMSEAHYKLQHTLLSIETTEAAKRMEVEHKMTKQEVTVLQHACQGRDSPGKDFVANLKAYCYGVEEDNRILFRRLEKAKKIIEMKDDELAEARREEEKLRTRIRENREHLNYLRSPGGIFHVATPKTGHSSYPATPQQYRSTPKHTPMTGRSVRQGRDHSQEPFAALLLADRVLSQENNSAPSTPIVSRRTDPRTPIRHNRGVQSLSSLPTTPRSNRPGTSNSTLLPSVQFTPQAESRITNAQPSRERRRKSRDSTISASDTEEIARAAMSSFRGESEEVQESQASQSATEMLRIDPHESFEVAASRTNTPTPTAEKSNLLQSKIFGSVTKHAEKRKRGEEDISSSAKKLRVGHEGIGLGIGFEAHV